MGFDDANLGSGEKALQDPATLPGADVEPAALSTVARAALIDFWERRADGEWTTAHALGHVRDDFVALDAPVALRDLVEEAIADEHRHTAWCQRMARRVGGAFRESPLLRGDRPFAFPGASPRLNRWLRPLFAGCISETIAIHVLRETQRDLRSPALREVNRKHMAEEVGHARLGWAFLAWLSESGRLKAEEQRVIAAALPPLIEFGSSGWLEGGHEGPEELTAFGFIHRRHVELGLRHALNEVIVPGFQRYGLATQVRDGASPSERHGLVG